jgi:sugar phosphate isomerase/epimerase
VFRFGYNTNGLAHHRLDDGFRLLADLGYEAVAVTPDVGGLDPQRPVRDEARELRLVAEELGLELVVESGSRFLLDPLHKHRPTLIEDEAAGRQRRLEFLFQHVDLAVELGAPLVSIWSGAVAPHSAAPREVHLARLVEGLRPLLDHADERDIAVALEPEPGMFIETCADFDRLVAELGADGGRLGLTVDVGHLLVTGEALPADELRARAGAVAHVHLDDIAKGEHIHRAFGAGDLDLGATISALLETGYSGVAAVELSRDSHRGAQAASQAIAALGEVL